MIVSKGATSIEEVVEELVAAELEEITLSLEEAAALEELELAALELSALDVAILDEAELEVAVLEVVVFETAALDAAALDEAALDVVGVDEETAGEELRVVEPQPAKSIATGRIQSKFLFFIMASRQP